MEPIDWSKPIERRDYTNVATPAKCVHTFDNGSRLVVWGNCYRRYNSDGTMSPRDQRIFNTPEKLIQYVNIRRNGRGEVVLTGTYSSEDEAIKWASRVEDYIHIGKKVEIKI